MKNEAVFSCNLFLLVFLFLGMIVAILSFEAIKQNEILLINILHNWNTKPYQSIQSTNEECGVGYSKISINKQVSTCDGSDILSYLDSDEENIPENYFLNSKNKYLCVKRMEDFNYFSFNVESEVCKKNEKNCGIMDTLGNPLCVAIEDVCPMSGLQIRRSDFKSNTSHLNSTTLLDNMIDYDEKTKKISLKESYTLFQTKDIKSNFNDNFIAVKIELIKEGIGANCEPFFQWNIKKKGTNGDNTTENTNEYKLLQNAELEPKKRQSNFYGTRYGLDLQPKSIDHKVNHKSDNKLKHKSIDKIPFLREYQGKNSTYQFFRYSYAIEFQPYIGWKRACLNSNNKNPKSLKNFHTKHIELYKVSKKIMVYYIVFLITMFVITILLYPCYKDYNYQSTLVTLNFIMMMMVLILPIMSLISYSWEYVFSPEQTFRIYENCSDNNTNKKLLGITNNLNFIINASTAMFLHIMFSFFISIYLAVFHEDEHLKTSKDFLIN